MTTTTHCLRLFTILSFAILAQADEVTDWNAILLQALTTPPAVAAPLAQRPAAIVHAAVFDAVNGIERQYMPLAVAPAAPRGASPNAAAVQAAYASLVHLFPAQTESFDRQRALSLAAISAEPDSIQRGIDWGQAVADAIWALRGTDGFAQAPPPFLGAASPGHWQPTPPAFAPALAPQMALITPWVIESPSQFRPAGPPALSSSQYAADFNETKSMGVAAGSNRTEDQTLYARFWNSTSPSGFWDPVAVSLAAERQFTLLDNARLLAHLNAALADAVIGCWDAKYAYTFWRPVTAIQQTADSNWTPLIPTPPFPEYPSAHSCVSAAAAKILTAYFGDDVPIRVTSDGMPGVIRNFSGFPAALAEVANARVFGGIHFRSACVDGQALGSAIGEYVVTHALLPRRGME